MKFKNTLQKLFCRHEWAKIGVIQDVDPIHNIRYGIRRYKCLKCGKISHQDSRRDKLESKAAAV